MSALQNNQFLLASGSPTDPTFPVQRSVRIRSSASAYFNRTLASSGTTATFSAWVKRGAFGSASTIFGTTDGSTYDFQLTFTAANTLEFYSFRASAVQLDLITTQVFRDPSAWYHIVLVLNTTNATAANRVQIFVNGVQVTAFSTATYPAQNAVTPIADSRTFGIGNRGNANNNYFDGYLTEINFIDGQALTPSSFGGYNSGTGVWEPRKYTGTYGTNGFYLNFQDNSGATATTIGKDSSGNGNNWTPNNISVTAGVTYDSMLDVPTNTSPTNSNFPTLNPLNGNNIGVGNLQVTGTATGGENHYSTIALPTTGKWYCEMSSTAYNASTIVGWFGVSNASGTNFSGLLSRVSGAGAGFFQNDTLISSTNIGALNTIFGLAVDRGANTITIYLNNVAQGTVPTLATGVDLFFYYGSYTSGTGWVNFGQRPFTYTPPTGFLALNTYNLPDPTIASGDDFHKVYTYTGNGGGLQVGEIQKPASLFNLDRSLRFRASANAYLTRTPASAGNRQKWTWAGWVKRGSLSNQMLFMCNNGTTDTSFAAIDFISDALNVSAYSLAWRTTNQVFRDPSIWYHIVVSFDTTQAVATDRVKVYINGIQITSFSTTNNPTQNTDYGIGQAAAHAIGQTYGVYGYLDGYLADVYFIDGQALTPTDFGAYDGNYYWTPKAYTGTYGTNGWHLEFEDFSAATAAAIGKDTSGQGNNWTPSGINVTTPANTNASWDSMTDVPTLTSTDVANFCTLTPLRQYSTFAPNLSNGNLTATTTSNVHAYGSIPFPNGVKTYCEMTLTTFGSQRMGIRRSTDFTQWGGWVALTTNIRLDDVAQESGLAGWATNDVIGMAVDLVNNTIQFYRNGTTFGSAKAIINADDWIFQTQENATSVTGVSNVNFGQRPFRYTPPTGFKSLNSFNVAEVTDDLESPDFVWIKSRSAATGHALFNSVTGVGKYLSSNATTAETTDVNSLIQFNKNGFLLGNAAIVNTSAATYVASAWKGGGAAVTNTAGSITSQVSANQKAGFSVVTWTGNGGSSETVGTGLSSATPLAMAIVKRRSGVSDWWVGHKGIQGQNFAYRVLLNSTAANSSSGPYVLGTQSASDGSRLYLASEGAANTVTYVAYCFSEIAGFSKFGSYTGTGNSDGAFVYTGFRPRWIMTKQTGAISNWSIHDTSRAPYNLTINELYSDTADAEYTGTNDSFDLLSNGFKPRSAGTPTNASGGTYIYVAFAENPFKYSLAR